ncbi:MAG TPA: pyroglutamyl-peptidase I [Blastocatellia bacterium]|nr:pyroglutamyl-peptidase I [Blastocatellia bacterium]
MGRTVKEEMMNATEKKILLTAFEPFGGEAANPSLEAARAMAGVEFPGASLAVLELPVDRFRAIEMTTARLRALRPDAIIMLGLAMARYRVTPERVAINVDDYRIPDNAGNQPAGEPIIEGGPVAYLSSLPIRAITDRLLRARIPAAISNTAGTYLCNRLFYGVMHVIATEALPTVGGFIHIPYMHEQALDKYPDVPSLARETLIEAVRLAVEVTLGVERGIKGDEGE